MASSAEREIRDAVVARLRELMPSARIVHELNVAGQGSNRIDVAAISETAIVGVEIKSEKDVLKRLDEQWAAFNKVCHYVIVAAHEKHFAEHREKWLREGEAGHIDLNHPLFFGKWRGRRQVWRFPCPDSSLVRSRHDGDNWFFDPFRDVESRFPLRSSDLLEMLWASELRAEGGGGSRDTRGDMISKMALYMTGSEVRAAVCRQLRARSFAEADPPIEPVYSDRKVPA